MIGIAVALIVLGLGAYVGTGAVSVTALIPAFFGIALAGLGALGLKDRFRLPSAYGGIVLSVIGLSGSVSGIPKVIAYLGGEEVPRPAASIAQSIMAVILLRADREPREVRDRRTPPGPNSLNAPRPWREEPCWCEREHLRLRVRGTWVLYGKDIDAVLIEERLRQLNERNERNEEADD